MSIKLTYDEVYNRFKEKGYELLDTKYVNNQTRMSCIDKDGYKYLVCNNLLQNGRTPEKYNVFNPYTIENVENFLRIESCGSKLLTKEYINNNMDLEITCEKCGEKITKKWSSIINRKLFQCHNCNNHSSNVVKYDYDFICKEFKDEGYIIIDSEYIGNNNKINCIDSDGYYVKHKYTDLKLNKTPNRFSLEFNEENYIRNINHYFELNNIDCCAENYSKEYKNFINLKCECGRKFKTDWASIKDGQIRCSYCSKTMSKMEHKVRNWLDYNSIEYIFQKRFDDCKNKRCLPFDFYLPKYNCCIEVDGQQHYFPSKFSDSMNELEEFEKRLKHDEIKTNYCKENNIDLLRISFNDIKRRNNNYIDILSNKFIKE